MTQNTGTLVIIGGHEDKEDDREILTFVADEVKRLNGSLVLLTAATHEPTEIARDYQAVFTKLGVERFEVVDIRDRKDAMTPENVERMEPNAVVFFTGGDQLRITSQIGDSPMYQRIIENYREHGAMIVGTSAGAAGMPDTMLVSGSGDLSARSASISMSPGLGFLPGVVIDSHFAERGRMGRLLGAVAQNPKNLGIGIDEDTAIVVEHGEHFRVMGSGAVYVVDGAGISASSLSEQTSHGVISIWDVKLHVLKCGDCFDLTERCPSGAQISEPA